MECQARGLTGLEFLVGIPGSIGGAIAMNAGAYGFEVKDFLKTIEIMDAAGNRSILNIEDLFMTYRQGNLPEATIVLKATFLLKKGNPEQIQKLIQENLAKREDTQPIHGRTGGSTFKNPEDPTVKAWQLIDQAGCRGLKQNDAMVSELHCNFLLNTDKAKASDLESLGEAVRTRVEQTTGVVLEWEIIRLGIVQDQRLKSNA
jgi:UDP-N-acetylmuramate dehydrogenase